jgi:UPF0042 nucleotide-binding protein
MLSQSETSDDAEPRARARQQILLVTGLLGAGKTTVLRVLEDLGWEAIDNFPIRLLERLIDTAASQAQPSGVHGLAIGFDTRTRGFNPHDIIARVKKLGARGDLEITTLFLDCSGRELERRYNETRRRHPLADRNAGRLVRQHHASSQAGSSTTSRAPGSPSIRSSAVRVP